MEMIFIVGVLFLLLGLAFDLGRKWERMEWDGSFDEQEAAQHGVHLTPMGVPNVEEDLPEFGTGGWMSAR